MVCFRSDLSMGREVYPIPVINELNNQMYPQFTYITQSIMRTPFIDINSEPIVRMNRQKMSRKIVVSFAYVL